MYTNEDPEAAAPDAQAPSAAPLPDPRSPSPLPLAGASPAQAAGVDSAGLGVTPGDGHGTHAEAADPLSAPPVVGEVGPTRAGATVAEGQAPPTASLLLSSLEGIGAGGASSKLSARFDEHVGDVPMTGTAPASERGGQGREPRQMSTVSNPSHTMPGGGSARRRPKRGGRASFLVDGGTRREIGVGTVGLYASKAVPVFREGRPAGATAPSVSASTLATAPSARRRTYPGGGGEAHRRSNTSHGNGSVVGVNDSDGEHGVTYYTSTIYCAPRPGEPGRWERREKAYQQWREDRLSRSLYHNFSGRLPATSAAGGAMSLGEDVDGSDLYGDTLSGGSDSLVERERRERLRARAIAEVRQAAEERRRAALAAESQRRLERRLRSRSGEAIDLPRAYYTRVRQVLPDRAQLPEDAITPADHRRACLTERAQRLAEREDHEERLRSVCRRQRESTRSDLQTARRSLAEYQTQVMEGLPRISRASARARAEAVAEQQRLTARMCRAERGADRELFAELMRSEAEHVEAHHRELHEHVGRVIARQGGAGVRPPTAGGSSRRGMGRRPPPSGGAQSQGLSTDTSAARGREGAGEREEPMATTGAAAAVTTATAAPTAAAVPSAVPALFQATTTNFFAEVKAWQQQFRSPNPEPRTGVDEEVRQQWLAQLSADRLLFNQETVSRHREGQPVRLQAARDEQAAVKHRQAEEQRAMRVTLQAQREAVEAGRMNYAQQVHRAQMSQRQRTRWVAEEQERERKQEAEMLRERSRMMEAMREAQRDADQRVAHEAVAAFGGV